jgi:hypothetical protein
MTLVDLTLLITHLNHLVDYDRHKGVSIDEVERHIENGDLFDWLGNKFAINLGEYTGADRTAGREITAALQNLLGGYRGRERRKWGVEHNGICLLIAWVNELVQQGGWQPRPANPPSRAA